MKLERYVVLNNCILYDLVSEYDIMKFNMVKNGNPIRYGVKKTSNNKLDLVEVGDLIGIERTIHGQLDNEKFTGEEVKQIITLKNRSNRDGETNKRIYFNGGYCRDCDVLSIYIREPGGNYKRYEI